MSATLIRGLKIVVTSALLSSVAHANSPVLMPAHEAHEQKAPDRAPVRVKKVPALVQHPTKVESLVHVSTPTHVSAEDRMMVIQRREAQVTKTYVSHYKQLVGAITDLPILSKDSPALAVILPDLSGSMEHTFKDSHVSKLDAVKATVNTAMSDFIARNEYDDGVKPRIEVAVLGYHGVRGMGGVDHDVVRSLLHPVLNQGVQDEAQHRVVATLPELQDYKGKQQELIPGAGPQKVFVDVSANGSTPMRKAFRAFRNTYAKWGANKSTGRLVLGIHVTDGESTDGDPAGQVAKLSRTVAARGDKLLMTNIHLSSNGTTDEGIIFPNDEDAAHFDEHGRKLFEMSSLVPAEIAARLVAKGIEVKPGSRMMAYNASIEGFSSVFAAGSSVAAQ